MGHSFEDGANVTGFPGLEEPRETLDSFLDVPIESWPN